MTTMTGVAPISGDILNNEYISLMRRMTQVDKWIGNKRTEVWIMNF